MSNDSLSFQDWVNITIGKVLSRIDEEVPQKGDFCPVAEYFINPDVNGRDVVGKYCLRVYKMPEDIVPDPQQRYVEAAAYAPDGSYKATSTVIMGHKEEIIHQMKSDSFPDLLNLKYGKLLYTLEH